MSLSDLKSKLSQLEKDFENTQAQIKNILKSNHQSISTDEVYCYFNQSMILNYEPNSSHLIMGNFHVKNMSNHPVTSPTILLKINSETEFNFTGKYKSAKQLNQKYNFLWERVELKNFDPITHYCLKPTQTDEIAPNEHLSFQNFQIKIPTNASIIVEGFVYYDEKMDGISAVNTINISV